MSPTCTHPTIATPKNKLINKIWACKKEKSDVIAMLKCVLGISRHGGTPMSHLLSREHVREACYLVYGGDNMTSTTSYQQCVKDNVKQHKKMCNSRKVKPKTS